MDRKKQGFLLLLAGVLLLALLLSGCLNRSDAEQEESAGAARPIDFSWEPHVYNSVYRTVFGEETERRFADMVDAILAGETSFPCPDQETMYQLGTIAKVCFPPYAALVEGIAFSEGTAHLSYIVGDAERERILEAFQQRIAAIVTDAVKEGDSQEMAAIALYHAYSQMIRYDYEAIENDAMVDVSSYRALAELEGICQSFAPAYAYLCLQCGIDAVNAGGLNEALEAHDWTLLTLDGAYFYADPTFENGYGGLGLRCFGMTAEQRQLEGGYIADDYNIGDTNLFWGRDIDVSDERFAPLWEAAAVTAMERKDGTLSIRCERDDGSEFVFLVK